MELRSREETNPSAWLYLYPPPAHILPARLGSTTRHSSSLVVCFLAIDLPSATAPSSCSSCSTHCLLRPAPATRESPSTSPPHVVAILEARAPTKCHFGDTTSATRPTPCGETGESTDRLPSSEAYLAQKEPRTHDGCPLASVSSLDADATRPVFGSLHAPLPSAEV